MSLKPEELAGWIRKAGRMQRVVEFQLPWLVETYFSLAYASKFILQQLREVSREMFTNPRTRAVEERLNEEKLRSEYAKTIVQGWRGLTVGKLRKLLPGSATIEVPEGMPDDTEVPFSLEIALALMSESFEFEQWVLDTASNIENFSKVAEQKKKELENLA